MTIRYEGATNGDGLYLADRIPGRRSNERAPRDPAQEVRVVHATTERPRLLRAAPRTSIRMTKGARLDERAASRDERPPLRGQRAVARPQRGITLEHIA